jgi:hypothetical protein
MREEKFVYEIIGVELFKHPLLKESAKTYLILRYGKYERRVNKEAYFLSELEAWEDFDKKERAYLQKLKDKVSVYQQRIQVAQKEIARLKRG